MLPLVFWALLSLLSAGFLLVKTILEERSQTLGLENEMFLVHKARLCPTPTAPNPSLEVPSQPPFLFTTRLYCCLPLLLIPRLAFLGYLSSHVLRAQTSDFMVDEPVRTSEVRYLPCKLRLAGRGTEATRSFHFHQLVPCAHQDNVRFSRDF